MAIKKDNQYFEAVGRRKTSVARVRLVPGSKNSFSINGKDLTEYFKTGTLQAAVEKALSATPELHFAVSVKVSGGGTTGQADAIKQGIARAIVVYDALLRPTVKKEGLLTRDPRAKERRKFGLKKARKSPQWSKR